MLPREDRLILKELSDRVHAIAQLPEQQKKRDMWRRHTALKHGIPPIFVSPEGAWDEFLPIESMQCQDGFAKEVEWELRQRIFRYEHIKDDTPIEDDYDIPLCYFPHNEVWGLPVRRQGNYERGSWHFVPVIEEMEDWKKLKKPRLEYDDRWVRSAADMLQDIVGDSLKVHLTGLKVMDYHLTSLYSDFRGLDNMLMDLIDEPEMVKDVFAFFCEGFEDLTRQAVELQLPESNNDYTYHYTGGIGYTDDLPPYKPGQAPLSHMWAAAEDQEYSCVSPEMFYDTVLPFEKKLLEPFGLTGYGCCDDLTNKLDGVLEIKNLRRVAACPWADLGKMAARLKKDYILTWKPNPAHLANDYFDEAAVEKYMTESLMAAKPGYPEIILRDTHSCRSDPSRFTKFVEITRRVIEQVYNL